MTEFSLDWPHGWQTRNGAFTVRKMIGTTTDGTLLVEFSPTGAVVQRAPSGRLSEGSIDCYDIINAPAPKPEPRKWWVNMWVDGDPGSPWTSGAFETKGAADDHALGLVGITRIACVCITEGDGLEENK